MHHDRGLRTFLAAVVAVTLLAIGVAGQCQPKGPNVLTGKERAQARVGPAAENVRILLAAFSLVDYGRRNHVPEALVVAANLIQSIGTTALAATPVNRSVAGSTQPVQAAAPGPNSRLCEPEKLLIEAEGMSGKDPTITAMIRRTGHKTSVRRNAIGGPQYLVRTVLPTMADVYTVWFRGGECARVVLKGDSNGDLDLYIYDEDGNLVACDTGPTDTCFTEWVPQRTGKFLIHVVNNGALQNQYELVTN